MTIGNFFGVLRRRWLLVLVCVLLTAGASAGAYSLSKPTYEATGTILFLPPKSSLVTGSPNPYLQLAGLEQAVDLVGVSLSDQATQLELQAISKNVKYTAKQDVNSSSPLLVVDVKDSSPETALRIRDALMAKAPQRLEVMQDKLSVSAKDRVSTSVVTLDIEAQEVGKNRVRAAVVVGGLGAAATLMAATMWDAFRSARSRARRSVRDETDIDESGDDADPDPDDSDESRGPMVASPPSLTDELETLQDRVDAPGAR